MIFEDVIGLDYSSMYPSIMVDLPDLTLCEIEELDVEKRTQKELKEDIKTADWAVIKAKVWTKPGKIQIFPVRAKIKTEYGKTEKVIRPVMNGQEVVMSKQTFEFFTEEYPHFKGIEITGGYRIIEWEIAKRPENRPFSWYRELYNNRIELLRIWKKDKRQLVIKIILNAGYGVTAETIIVEIWEVDKTEK